MNWHERIDAATLRGKFTEADCEAAAYWVTRARAEQADEKAKKDGPTP